MKSTSPLQVARDLLAHHEGIQRQIVETNALKSRLETEVQQLSGSINVTNDAEALPLVDKQSRATLCGHRIAALESQLNDCETRMRGQLDGLKQLHSQRRTELMARARQRFAGSIKVHFAVDISRAPETSLLFEQLFASTIWHGRIEQTGSAIPPYFEMNADPSKEIQTFLTCFEALDKAEAGFQMGTTGAA